MKNLLKFFNRSGKMALSALQAAGLTAVVGVAGIAAYQYIGGGEETNTAFNPSQYDAGEVVYVAGANTGSYQSGSYYGHGAAEPGTSLNVSAKTLNRLDRQAQAEEAAREMAEESASIQASSASGSEPLTAYEMGATEGLGMAGNAVNEKGFAGGDSLAAVSGAMGNIQGMISNAQQQAQAAAQGGAAEGEAAAAGAPTLASAKTDWGSKFGGGSGGANSSFALQDSGKNKGKGGSAPAADMAQQMAAMQAQAQSMLESSRIRGRSSFGNTEGLGANRNATIGQGRRSGQGNVELEQIRKQSADIAANKNRAANEGSRPFLASTQLSGGVRVTKENFEANSTQGASTDFNNSFNGNLGNIQNWGQEQIDFNEQKLKDYTNLLLLWIGVGIGTVIAMFAVSYLAALAKAGGPFTAWLWVAAGVVAAIAVAANINLIIWAAKYADDYGGSAFSTWAGLTGCIGIAGIAVSFFVNLGEMVSKGLSKVKDLLMGGGKGSAAATQQEVETVLNELKHGVDFFK